MANSNRCLRHPSSKDAGKRCSECAWIVAWRGHSHSDHRFPAPSSLEEGCRKPVPGVWVPPRRLCTLLNVLHKTGLHAILGPFVLGLYVSNVTENSKREQDPNGKGSKERYFSIRTRQNQQIFGVIFFVKLQKDT